MKNTIKKHGFLLLGCLITFVGIYIFFAAVHPIIPYDNDDWAYLSRGRSALPTLTEWNPSRIFYEVLMPIAGYLAAYVIYPLTNNYIGAISLSAALFLALFATFYYYGLFRLFHALCKSKAVAFCLGILVLIMSFSIFKTKPGSVYLFRAYDMDAYFAYVIPHLLNSALVCLWMAFGYEKKRLTLSTFGIRKFAIFTVILYFSLFSMIYSSAILVIYIIFELLVEVISKKKKDCKLDIAAFVKEHAANLLILLVFLASFILESLGSRASMDNGRAFNGTIFSGEFWSRASESLGNIFAWRYQLNKLTAGFILMVGVVAIAVFILNRKKDTKIPIVRLILGTVFCGIGMMFYLALLSAQAGPAYCNQIHMIYGLFFYILLFTGISLCYLINRYKQSMLVLPLILVILFAETVNPSKLLDTQNGYGGGNWQWRQQVMSQLVEEVRQADKAGLTEITVLVPKTDNPKNWPIHTESFGKNFSRTLYTHGLISQEIKVQVQPTDEFTIKESQLEKK